MAADCLSQVLEDMRLEDGRPDYLLRRSAIQHLLNSSTLTFGEKRIFNAHFKGIGFVHDIIAELPIELLALLVEYVDLEDFMSMRSVNRVWRAKLSNDKVSMSILRVHFRRTWEDLKLLDEKDKKLRLDCLPRFCTTRLKRYRRKYDEVCIHPKRHVFRNISHQHHLRGNKGLFQYCNGRVAMMMDYTVTVAIQVDSLWTLAETCYMHEQRYRPDHWLLSNQTLVAYFDHPVESIDDDGLVAILPIPHAEGDGSILHMERNENKLDFPQPPPCCKHGISSATASGLPNYSFLAFNVFTQEFQNISNHLKAIPVDPCCDKPLLWRGQGIVLCGKEGFESIPSTPDGKPLKALVSASVCDEKRKFKCVGGHGLRDNVKAAAAFRFPIETPLQTHLDSDSDSDFEFGVWRGRKRKEREGNSGFVYVELVELS
ncbi:predicted protein [Sclerotinia sclerotiorum 1980 UF-70]|uniref:F-box domain-containing protein n=1 Tax=Sclerotinia sclerotiorum (strain ATCC 18683 / 1980 / Ss-1) TaxID=665079 RepID=A7E8L7_SCLS1|nr:predicted protein [Sclerotinia sclerotiorum 1980 UF-70]EDN96719.1 predicted protein [Sclerotinia sclerotiorum 1980 UF-70]